MSVNSEYICDVDICITFGVLDADGAYDYEGEIPEVITEPSRCKLYMWDEGDGCIVLIAPEGEIPEDVEYDCGEGEVYPATRFEIGNLAIAGGDNIRLCSSGNDVSARVGWNAIFLESIDGQGAVDVEIAPRYEGRYATALCVRFGV